MLEVENMTLCLSGRRILKDINLSIGHGEFLGVIGPTVGEKLRCFDFCLESLNRAKAECVGGCVLQKINLELDTFHSEAMSIEATL